MTFRPNLGPFLPIKPTKGGELVRSTKEVGLANLLRRLGIQYEYEKEIILDGERLIPDFFLPRYDVYVEYYGLVHWKSYAKRTAYKIKKYAEHGIRCIHLFESSVINMNRILRYEMNKIHALKPGEPYVYKAELPYFTMLLEKQTSFKKTGKLKWEPVLDRILLMSKDLDENVEILAKVVRKGPGFLKKRIKSLESRQRKKELEEGRNKARAKLDSLSIKYEKTANGKYRPEKESRTPIS